MIRPARFRTPQERPAQGTAGSLFRAGASIRLAGALALSALVWAAILWAGA